MSRTSNLLDSSQALTVFLRLETVACAISLGLIGIWCMHFVGNRAIILGDGTPDIQLVYSPGYSTLSVFLPIIGLTIAFSAAEYPSRLPRLHWVALGCTGIFAGLSIVGMHYIGNFGISNYSLDYVPRFLVASIIIAIGDCAAVLILFYTWREKWISAWWKRLLCAAFLAGGVSAMHFTASTHCVYRFKHLNDHSAIRSRDVQVAVAGGLCGTAVIITFCVLFVTRYRARARKRSSQKVMLASAMFDPDGRIMVTTEGVLPAREITDKYNHRTFSEDFDTAHPVFQWIFRVTRSWSGVSELIPKMKSHLNAHRASKQDDSRPSSSSSSAVYDLDTYSDYAVVFRERFCTAAASLASSMHIPVEKVGVLYDDIVDTGTLQAQDRFGKRRTIVLENSMSDVEMGFQEKLFGRGQLLFLTRSLSAEDVDKMLNAGYKFATIQHVGRNIAETMQIPLSTLEVHVSSLRRYVENLSTLEKPGTWLSCFAMIPKANTKGFDVAVKRDEHDQLPDVQLLPSEPLPWQADFLRRMDSKAAPNCMAFLEDRNRRDTGRSLEEQDFAVLVLQSMVKLSQILPGPWFQTARFYGSPVQAHYSQPLRDRAPLTIMYSFVVCTDLHTPIEACCNIKRVPLSFFNVRQQCYRGSPNQVEFAREIHVEFGPLLARKTTKRENQHASRISAHIPSLGGKKFAKAKAGRPATAHDNSDSNTDSSSDTYELVDKSRSMSESTQEVDVHAERNNFWGGILVSSETTSKTEYTGSKTRDAGLDTSMRVAVGTSRPEDTFVDELVTFARATMPSKVGL